MLVELVVGACMVSSSISSWLVVVGWWQLAGGWCTDPFPDQQG